MVHWTKPTKKPASILDPRPKDNTFTSLHPTISPEQSFGRSRRKDATFPSIKKEEKNERVTDRSSVRRERE